MSPFNTRETKKKSIAVLYQPSDINNNNKKKHQKNVNIAQIKWEVQHFTSVDGNRFWNKNEISIFSSSYESIFKHIFFLFESWMRSVIFSLGSKVQHCMLRLYE